MLPILLLGALIGQSTGTGVQRPPLLPGELKIVVAAPVYLPDGGVTAETTTLTGGTPTVVHVYGRRSVCETSVAGASEPADAGFGWRLASQALNVTDSVVSVSIDWRRVWDRGRKITNGPSGTVQLKLHPGDRIPLDHISNPAATDACRAVGVGLEIRLARTASPVPVNSALVPLGAVAGGGPAIAADLWLVQTLPSGAEQALHQKVRLDSGGGSFGFAPVKVTGERGELGIEVLGTFQRYRAPVGGEFVYVTITRAITGESVPAGGVRGGTGTMIPLPDPSEVVSLEIPTFGGISRGRSPGGTVRGGAGGGGARGGGNPGGARSSGGGGTFSEVERLQALAAQRGGGGGARGGRGAGSAEGVTGGFFVPPQALEILQGHKLSLRMRLTPVAGS
jgi:hypothetical protein